MLENILNNVNATQEVLKPKNDVKKSEDTAEIPNSDSFKNLLQKHLSKEDEKTKEESKPSKPKISNDAQNDSLSHLADKDSHFMGLDKPISKDTLKNANHLSPTQELLSATSEKNNPQSEKNLTTKLGGSALENIDSKDIKSTKNSEKKLSDIQALGKEKNLKADNIKLQTNQSTTQMDDLDPNSTTQSKSIESSAAIKPTTQSVLDQKLKTTTMLTSKNAKEQNKPLSTMLKSIDEKELKTRKKFNRDHKIEYKIENKTEKIAIIERGKNLPKNIVEPRIYQEKRATKLEEMNSKNQILQESIGGKITKDIKLKTSPEEKKIDDSKENVQKKTKKLGTSSKSKSGVNQASNDQNTKTQIQDQNKQIQNQLDEEKFLNQEETLQSTTIAKNKKTTDAKEVEKTKDKTTQGTPTQKDSTSTLGVVPKNDLLYKSSNAKETIKNFAQNLSEEIKNYKPPMSKISLELNPEKLGKVELTIKQIGNNLHVSVVSNNQAIALFVQNQADLKQNLAMIGFSGVDLNFSSQDGSQKQNQDSDNQKRNKNSLKEYEDIKKISQTPYDTMEIVLPKYA
ncbi:hypothetical protein BKH42_04730 [Helicobacter sp. 13S00482-2]|uniref:flagellar hook-length control protein FliK n=1 Tax=Helicobacter sp. 13S00482-2 TaxID=1476200 RepID=UPI000BA54CF9|nr:flagellar hook-length control protein FliK [Helicobacter sp. 13S00482-2]PAF53628.1 hypothetical protein BKH42_04730 [Helicobacter sp. 13S00482-2]